MIDRPTSRHTTTMHSITAPLLLAGLLHDASRAHVIAAGDTATEFADLHAETQEALLSTATSLLAIVEPWCPAAGSAPFADAVDWLACHINTAAHANGPSRVPFESLSSEAQAFRQAEREGVAVSASEPRKHFVIVTLGRQAGRYLGQDDLDHRRPATPARASPGRPSRPAPPQNPGSLPPDVPSDFGDYEGDETT